MRHRSRRPRVLHGDTIVATQLRPMEAPESYNTLIDALLARIGVAGTLAMPTSTYSFTRSEPFDARHLSSMAGAITDHFGKRPGVLRSCNPMVSVAAFGRLAHVFAGSNVTD